MASFFCFFLGDLCAESSVTAVGKRNFHHTITREANRRYNSNSSPYATEKKGWR
jgi:hypothetical protein